MQQTKHVDWINKEFEGYVVNTAFSSDNNKLVMNLIEEISQKFPDIFYPMPSNGLHITLMDWIAPLVAYENPDKAKLFQDINQNYDMVLADVVSKITQIKVNFNKIIVTPTTIIITGEDDGSFQKIRDQFINNVELLPGTKMPPTIIHCSLGRFVKEVPLKEVQDFINKKSVNFIQVVDEFRLVNTHREPMLEFDILKTYKLGLF